MKKYIVIWQPCDSHDLEETEFSSTCIDAALNKAWDVIPEDARLINVMEA